MDSSIYTVAERRPIASRELAIFQRMAEWLAARGVSANGISVAGMMSGIAAGIALGATAWTPEFAWLYWVLGAVFIQLRLLANMLDGMVATRSGTASRVGELYNEVPDRVSDVATLIGLGYAAGSNPALGYAAACVAVFVAYVRAMGKVAGAHQEFCGPMAKPHRMATVTVTALLCAAMPLGLTSYIPMVALGLIAGGGLFTAWRRLDRIAAALHAR